MKKAIFLLSGILVGIMIYSFLQYKGATLLNIQKEQTPQTLGEKTNNLGLDLPPGFQIEIFAKDLASPRSMIFDPKGNMIVSITKKGKVVVLIDKNGDKVSDETKTLIDNLKNPHGLEFKDGKLYIAQEEQITSYDYDEENLTISNPQKIIDLPAGQNHITRTIKFNKNGDLFVSLGSTCNVCKEKDPRHASILKVDVKRKSYSIFATGLRNSPYFVLHPFTEKIWATEMGRDFLGDKIPPDEVNIIEKGKNYGWPYCYGKKVHDRNFDPKGSFEICNDTEPPTYEVCAHCAPLGIAFIDSKQFPKSWQGDLLVAYHGSWNSTKKVGYKVVRLDVEGSTILKEEDFLTGFLKGSQDLGRPADLIFAEDGSLYVSDDKAGIIYRIFKP